MYMLFWNKDDWRLTVFCISKSQLFWDFKNIGWLQRSWRHKMFLEMGDSQLCGYNKLEVQGTDYILLRLDYIKQNRKYKEQKTMKGTTRHQRKGRKSEQHTCNHMPTEKDAYLMLSVSAPGRSKRETERRLTDITQENRSQNIIHLM